MPEAWTGELIGRMHNSKITYDDLAAELQCGKSYICAILNGRRNPHDARERLNAAFERVLDSRKENCECRD